MERRDLGAHLWQAQKMVAVRNMTAGIAHDFKNVLAVILAMADLVAPELGPEDASSQGDLEELRAAAVWGSEMIRGCWRTVGRLNTPSSRRMSLVQTTYKAQR